MTYIEMYMSVVDFSLRGYPKMTSSKGRREGVGKADALIWVGGA